MPSSLSKESSSSRFIKPYLVLYNGLQFSGWTYIFYKLLKTLVFEQQSLSNLYPAIKTPLHICQLAALLESIHSIIGITPSGWQTALMQCIGRLFITFVAVDSIPFSKYHNPALVSLTSAWSLSEMIRYLFYISQQFSKFPFASLLNYIRYTAFIPLYPIGMISEFALLLTSLWKHYQNKSASDRLKKSHIGLILLFITSAFKAYPTVFSHMLKQRRKNVK